MKLTRQKIKEALDTVPIETVLLGSSSAHGVKLTSKQKEFARQIALGETKASAYRKSRSSKAKPETASKRGQELAKHGAIAAQIDAFKLAFEAQRYTSPAHLRALAIQQLTEHSLNPDWPPAQRVKCLELIGKMTEVSLFTERREIVQVTDSAQIKDRLMDTLRTITQAQVTDVTDSGRQSTSRAGRAGHRTRAGRAGAGRAWVHGHRARAGPPGRHLIYAGPPYPPPPRRTGIFWYPP
jgi:hypothetical protein